MCVPSKDLDQPAHSCSTNVEIFNSFWGPEHDDELLAFLASLPTKPTAMTKQTGINWSCKN